MSGLLITFEGCEGSGKSTLISKVYTNLLELGVPLLKTKEPGGTEIGEKIRQLLLNDGKPADLAELFLFLADRSQHVEEVVYPAIIKGQIVLCDRFIHSTIAYQSGGRTLPFDMVKSLCKISSKNIYPSIIIYIDVDPKLGLARKYKHSLNRIDVEKIEFHDNVRKTFLDMETSEDNFYKIDVSKPVDLLALEVTNRIQELIKDGH